MSYSQKKRDWVVIERGREGQSWEKPCRGLVPKLSHFQGASALDHGLTHGFCHSSVGGSVLACLTSHLETLVTWLWASWVLSGSRRPASLEGNNESGGSPPSSWGVKGSSQISLSLSAWGVGRAQNWHPTENMSSITPFPHFYPYCLMHVNGIEMCDAQMMVEIAVVPNHSEQSSKSQHGEWKEHRLGVGRRNRTYARPVRSSMSLVMSFFWLSISSLKRWPDIYTEENQNWKRHLYPSVHHNTVYNSQDMETT